MRTIFCFLLSMLILHNFAQADYALRWSPLAGTSTGAPITVDLFLDETGLDTNLVNFGAVGASYVVNLSGVGSLATPVANANFDLASTSGSGASVTVEQTSIAGLVEPSGSLKIGSFTINPTGNGNGTLSLALFGSLADFAVYDNANVPQVLDGTLFPAPSFAAPSYNFSFTAVPEPGSIGTCTMLAAMGLFRRRRRMKPGEADRWKRWRRRYQKRPTSASHFSGTKNWN